MEISNELYRKIQKYCEDNPYIAYADYRDELPLDMVELLLEDRQKFDEEWFEVEQSYYDYADWQYWEEDAFDEFAKLILGDEHEETCFDDFPDKVKAVFYEYRYIDTSDALRSHLRQTRAYIVAVPEKRNGDTISPPNYECDSIENKARNRYLRDSLGINGNSAESMYHFEVLKVCGTLDLQEVYEKGKPTHVIVGPGDSLVTHSSLNGSGGLGDLTPTRRKKFKATFHVDELNRYGVQAVYGFTGRFWEHELSVAYEPW